MNDFYLLAIIIIFMVVVIRIALVSFRTPHSHENWLSTKGVVNVYRVNAWLGSIGREIFEPMFKCQYTVNGVTYTL